MAPRYANRSADNASSQLLRRLSRHGQLLACIAAPWLTQQAYALDTHIEIGAAAEHHSNALRTPDDEQSDTLQILLARLGLQHDGPTLTTDINYDIENQRYADDSFGDENVVNGNAAIDWRLWQESVSLLADHSVADTAANSTQPDTPDNRTRRSVLAVGPRFTARISPVDNLALTTRKIDVTVDEAADTTDADATTQNDSERDETSLQWNHRLSETRSFYIGTSYADVTFDQAPAQDYTYNAVFAGAELNSRLFSMSLQAGTNTAKRDDTTQEDTDGETLSATLRTRDSSAPIQASAYYLKAITDSSIGFVGQTALPDDISGESENLDIIDIIEREQTGINSVFYLGSSSTQLLLDASLQKQDYQQQLRDDDTRILRATILRQSTETVRTRLYIENTDQEFLDENTKQKDRRFGMGIDYSPTRAITLRSEAYRLKRDHSTPILSYEDTVFRVEITYSFDRSSGTASSTP